MTLGLPRRDLFSQKATIHLIFLDGGIQRNFVIVILATIGLSGQEVKENLNVLIMV